jgi:DNA replication protein DnaC
MLKHPTLEKLKTMKLDGMAQALVEQLEMNVATDLGFEERLGLLVDREANFRDNKRLGTKLRNAKLRHQASIENIDYAHSRQLDRSLVQDLAGCNWLKQKHNLIITGPTGVGKTYLACALGHQACRYDFTVIYKQTSRLLQELVISKGDGRYFRILNKLSKTNLLILDDWGLDTPTPEQRRVLLELLDDRYERGSTLIASQLPVDLWYENLADPTLADAILDRIIHNAYRLILKGESLRKTKNNLTQSTLEGS